MRHALAGKKIFVTGGTGFIGGRVVEKLVSECDAHVRVLIRNYARALPIARYPVELVRGDIVDSETMQRAVEGSDVIIHCAYGISGDEQSRRSVNVLGTKNILEAGFRSGVKRFIHISTVQVYGRLSDGDLDETKPKRYFGDGYSNSKLDAEKIALAYYQKHGLPLVIIQPTIVYGPDSLVWTEHLLNTLRKERHILVDYGVGFCNAVYIDDVADAIVLAAVRDEAVGESFLISAAEPVTWKDFYAAHERMLGISATIGMTAAEAEAYDVKNRPARHDPSIFKAGLAMLRDEPIVRSRLLHTREMTHLKRLAAWVLPADKRDSIKRFLSGPSGAAALQNGSVAERPIRLLSFPLDVNYYKTKTTVRIDKARRLLGYEPAFDLALGMKLTEQWAKWANLIGNGDGLR
jgi:nucleoside-diphosphate-sugar epimerase